MKRRIVASFLMALLVLGCLAGCSGSSSSSSDSGSDESSSSDGVIELSLWHYFESDEAMMEDAVNRFNEEHDGEIHITATYVSREELMNQYTIGAVSGELPDIGMVDSPDMASYISLGIFEDVTAEMEEWGELDNFFEGPLSSCMDADGNIYGLPHNTNCIALAVNLDALAEAGYDDGPTSLDQLVEMAAATTDASDGTYGFAMSAISTEEGTFQVIPWLVGTQDGESTTIADLTADSSVKGLETLGTLVENGYMSTECVSWTQSDAYNQFVAGKAVMAEVGTWHLSTMAEDVDGAFNYKIMLLPTGDEGTTTSTIGGENFGVCSSTEYREACIEFLQYICSVEEQETWAEGSGKISIRYDASPEYTYEQDNFAVFEEQMDYATARGPHAEWPTISEAIYTAAQSVFVDGTSASDALATAAGTIDPILEENPLP